VRLSECSVFVDFDGTISTNDIGTYLLERLVPGQWEEIDQRYEQATIGSREYVTELCRLLPPGRELLQAIADEVPLDPTFGPFVAFLRQSDAEVTVVSDGLGFYVPRRCAQFKVPVLSCRLVDGTPVFPHADPTCSCGACGTCKVRPVRQAQQRGRSAIVIGDGTSDRFAAQVADMVFAKDRLAEWCQASGIEYRPFRSFAEIERDLRGLSSSQC
jgi:2-hydroxy-3-keto-5-methylthiopentenyl-1-phosphate phosphatase